MDTMKWELVSPSYWEVSGNLFKVVLNRTGGVIAEHIGIIKNFIQDKDFIQEGTVIFEDGFKMFAPQGYWLDFYVKELENHIMELNKWK